MVLTEEQHKIINSTGDIKINAVAGSGKTSTIIEYAKARPTTSKILYLAFNRTVKLEAIKKFADKGISNVTVETAHSLAYKHVVRRHNYKVRNQGYQSYEIAELLGISGSGEKHAEYIIANHINKFVTLFCNSEKLRVQDVSYLDVVTEPKAKNFVKANYAYIENKARKFLSLMDKGEIEIIHDFYLKKFQLSRPQLSYDYILFDEGQDASSAMLDIFLHQQATKVIVGDTHQQIYGWRYAINSLEKINFPNFYLSTSFRFGQKIADLARSILQWKNTIGTAATTQIIGMGKSETKQTKAVIGRTNLGLLLKAIQYVQDRKDLKHIYFEGNINSYTYADEGASLYDVLNLQNHRRDKIKDKLIGAMQNMEELEDYIEKTEDVQLGMMLEIVQQYGNKIPAIIKSIKDRHVGDEDRHKAQIVFSTVHRAKGMEYDSVQLVDDFITEEKLDKQKDDKTLTSKLNEEINLLYVAITRAKNLLYIPESMIPQDHTPCTDIMVIKKEIAPPPPTIAPYQRPTTGRYGTWKQTAAKKMKVAKKDPPKKWLKEDDEELKAMHAAGMNTYQLAEYFTRTNGAIRARLKKLNLPENEYW